MNDRWFDIEPVDSPAILLAYENYKNSLHEPNHRDMAIAFCKAIEDNCPPCADTSAAIRSLRLSFQDPTYVMFHASAAKRQALEAIRLGGK